MGCSGSHTNQTGDTNKNDKNSNNIKQNENPKGGNGNKKISDNENLIMDSFKGTLSDYIQFEGEMIINSKEEVEKFKENIATQLVTYPDDGSHRKPQPKYVKNDTDNFLNNTIKVDFSYQSIIVAKGALLKNVFSSENAFKIEFSDESYNEFKYSAYIVKGKKTSIEYMNERPMQFIEQRAMNCNMPMNLEVLASITTMQMENIKYNEQEVCQDISPYPNSNNNIICDEFQGTLSDDCNFSGEQIISSNEEIDEFKKNIANQIVTYPDDGTGRMPHPKYVKNTEDKFLNSSIGIDFSNQSLIIVRGATLVGVYATESEFSIEFSTECKSEYKYFAYIVNGVKGSLVYGNSKPQPMIEQRAVNMNMPKFNITK